MVNSMNGTIFIGPKGVGKKKEALWHARDLLCTHIKEKSCTCQSCLLFNSKNHPDFLEIEEEFLTLEKLEVIKERATLNPAISRNVVILIDHAESLNEESQNSLLKLIEESNKMIFLLVTNKELKATIQSRLQRISFHPFCWEKWKEIYGDASLELFLATAGCPGMIPLIENHIPLWNMIGGALFQKNITHIMKLLHILKEKDSKSFFLCHREAVPYLFHYLGELVKRNALEDIKWKEVFFLLKKEELSSLEQQYRKEDFFFFWMKVEQKGLLPV